MVHDGTVVRREMDEAHLMCFHEKREKGRERGRDRSLGCLVGFDVVKKMGFHVPQL
jgi:hypothetical protein